MTTRVATLGTRPGLGLEPPGRPAPRPVVLSTAELAACTCPEPCERDHDRD